MASFPLRRFKGIKTPSILTLLLFLFLLFPDKNPLASQEIPTTALNDVFEARIVNAKPYKNPFNFEEIELRATFISPRGHKTKFWGFYDGDGEGGRDGNIWKLRFMPDEAGRWTYKYTWSDGTLGGRGEFKAVTPGALPGVLRAYQKNPRWFAYNGKTPVFLKSYFVSIWHFTGTPLEWSVENVYKKIAAQGYNHIQLPILPVNPNQEPNFTDAPETIFDPLFKDAKPSQSMNLKVWKRLEEHLFWLNKNKIAVHFFQGFDGKDTGPRWKNMTAEEREFYVRYVTARLAPLSNIAGWNYTWETPGNWNEPELMELLKRFDPWEHLRSYEDQFPLYNYYCEEHYTFAGIENQGYLSSQYAALSHHYAALHSFCGKPVYMAEGNGLWMWGWYANEDQIRRAAWAVVTAGASFTWNDIPDARKPGGSDELKNHSGDIFHSVAFQFMEYLYGVMTQDLVFHRMNPHDEFISGFTGNGFCLAEKGEQYLAFFEDQKNPFIQLDLTHAKPAASFTIFWMDTKTGQRIHGEPLIGGAVRAIPAPGFTEAVLVVKAENGL